MFGHAGTVCHGLICSGFHIHVLRRHEGIGRFGGEVRNDRYSTMRSALNVHAHVLTAYVHLAVHLLHAAASAVGGSHLHVGGERHQVGRSLRYHKLQQQGGKQDYRKRTRSQSRSPSAGLNNGFTTNKPASVYDEILKICLEFPYPAATGPERDDLP